jgi:hypothetical protein
VSNIAAFDAKEFNRTRIAKVIDSSDRSKVAEKTIGFFSPIGSGVVTSHPDFLENSLKNEFEKLRVDFKFQCDMPFLGSREIMEQLGGDLSRTIAFCDQLIKGIQDFIDSLFFSYIVLPPGKVPTVTVGGERCPNEEIETHEFLRSATPAFSAIAAFVYKSHHAGVNSDILIDGFRYKRMRAWDNLLTMTTPVVYPHGDECNPFISIADIIAFLTDAKLYSLGRSNTEFRKLTPQNIENAWKDYSFEVETRFLDDKTLGYIAWRSKELINAAQYYKRPMLFFIADRQDVKQLVNPLPSAEIPGGLAAMQGEEMPFSKQLRRMPIFRLATRYAYIKRGCIQFYNPNQDAVLVRDGDTVIYMGKKSKEIADQLSDAYDIEKLRAKDLKERIKKY